MLDTLGRYWRVVGTGSSFLVFGIGGVVLRVVVFPLLHLLVWNDALRRRLAREIISFCAHGFIDYMSIVGVVRYKCVGFERLERRGLLILANHPTLIDTLYLMAFVEDADCVVDATLWNNPFTRGPVRAAGYVRNDAGVSLVETGIATLEKGGNLVIFPEGTRTRRGGGIHMKRGAANIAVRGLRDITPVIIRCVPLTLTKGEKWWNVPPRLAELTIEVREDIAVRPFVEAAAEPALAARRLNTHLEQFFSRESHADAVA